MKTIILDIETKPRAELIDKMQIEPDSRLKDPVKIEASILEKKGKLRKTMSVDTDLAEIAMVGVKVLGQEPEIMSLKSFCKFIDAAGSMVYKQNSQEIFSGFRLVTFNGKRFDLPLLIKTGARLSLDMPYGQFIDMTRRYTTDLHIDLMEVLSFDGKFRSKDDYVRYYLGKEPTPIDFETCTDEELEAHCIEDLVFTEELYEMFKGRLYV